MPPPAATQAAARLWTQPTKPFLARHSYRSSVKITRTLWWQTWFTRGRLREWKSGHNSITVQNRTHVYMNFFDHKDLGNHLLQLCPKVVKHPVYLFWNANIDVTLTLVMYLNDVLSSWEQLHHALTIWKGCVLENVFVSWNSITWALIFSIQSHVTSACAFLWNIFQHRVIINIFFIKIYVKYNSPLCSK
jgi:hypothetical protein